MHSCLVFDGPGGYIESVFDGDLLPTRSRLSQTIEVRDLSLVPIENQTTMHGNRSDSHCENIFLVLKI